MLKANINSWGKVPPTPMKSIKHSRATGTGAENVSCPPKFVLSFPTGREWPTSTKGERAALSPMEQEVHADLQESFSLNKKSLIEDLQTAVINKDKQLKRGNLTRYHKEKLSHSKLKSLPLPCVWLDIQLNSLWCFFICKMTELDGMDFWKERRRLLS